MRVIAACTAFVLDAVVAGHDRDYIGLLVFPPQGAARDPQFQAGLRAALAAHNAPHPASSTRIARALVMEEPLSIDGGEMTDKGYINQRAVLRRRGALVERLYADPPDESIVCADAM